MIVGPRLSLNVSLLVKISLSLVIWMKLLTSLSSMILTAMRLHRKLKNQMKVIPMMGLSMRSIKGKMQTSVKLHP